MNHAGGWAGRPSWRPGCDHRSGGLGLGGSGHMQVRRRSGHQGAGRRVLARQGPDRLTLSTSPLLGTPRLFTLQPASDTQRASCPFAPPSLQSSPPQGLSGCLHPPCSPCSPSPLRLACPHPTLLLSSAALGSSPAPCGLGQTSPFLACPAACEATPVHRCLAAWLGSWSCPWEHRGVPLCGRSSGLRLLSV